MEPNLCTEKLKQLLGILTRMRKRRLEVDGPGLKALLKLQYLQREEDEVAAVAEALSGRVFSQTEQTL